MQNLTNHEGVFMSIDQDREYIRLAEIELDMLFNIYYSATPTERWQLKPAIEKAVDSLSTARLSLFKTGILTTNKDMDNLKALKAEIESAANLQSTILAAIQLAALLGVFA